MNPEIVHHFSDGLYAKETFIPKDMILKQHKHNYSHLSILAKGSVVVNKDGDLTVYKAPCCIDIEKRNLSWCISLRRLCLVLYPRY
jgi:hypothetical protein